jgi:hypothetical protein
MTKKNSIKPKKHGKLKNHEVFCREQENSLSVEWNTKKVIIKCQTSIINLVILIKRDLSVRHLNCSANFHIFYEWIKKALEASGGNCFCTFWWWHFFFEWEKVRIGEKYQKLKCRIAIDQNIKISSNFL